MCDLTLIKDLNHFWLQCQKRSFLNFFGKFDLYKNVNLIHVIKSNKNKNICCIINLKQFLRLADEFTSS